VPPATRNELLNKHSQGVQGNIDWRNRQLNMGGDLPSRTVYDRKLLRGSSSVNRRSLVDTVAFDHLRMPPGMQSDRGVHVAVRGFAESRVDLQVPHLDAYVRKLLRLLCYPHTSHRRTRSYTTTRASAVALQQALALSFIKHTSWVLGLVAILLLTRANSGTLDAVGAC
jgi:hypothetical protein